jgi:hypothetical protein
MSVTINGTEYDFDINFYWINKSLDEKQQYIIPTTGNNDDEHSADLDLHCKSMYDIATTYNSQEEVVNIILWYDSKVTTTNAIGRTKLHFITKMISLDCYKYSISVKDIRDIQYIDPYRNNTEIDRKVYDYLMGSNINVYFRADFIRMVIANRMVGEAIENNWDYIHVFSNLDIVSFGGTEENPFTLETLFDNETKSKLCDTGFLLAHNLKVPGRKYENNFFMLSTCNKITAELHRCYEDYIVIKCEPDRKTGRPIKIDSQVVYDRYKDILSVMLDLNNYITHYNTYNNNKNVIPDKYRRIADNKTNLGSLNICSDIQDFVNDLMTYSIPYTINPEKQNNLKNPYKVNYYREHKNKSMDGLTPSEQRTMQICLNRSEFEYSQDIYWPHKKPIIGTKPRDIYDTLDWFGNTPVAKPTH